MLLPRGLVESPSYRDIQSALMGHLDAHLCKLLWGACFTGGWTQWSPWVPSNPCDSVAHKSWERTTRTADPNRAERHSVPSNSMSAIKLAGLATGSVFSWELAGHPSAGGEWRHWALFCVLSSLFSVKLPLSQLLLPYFLFLFLLILSPFLLENGASKQLCGA